MKIAVYSPNWIGDSVLALPFIRCLRVSYPNAEIYIFCKEWVSGIYENNLTYLTFSISKMRFKKF